MAIFSPRKTPSENIAYSASTLALFALSSLAIAYIPLFGLLLTVFLPLFSSALSLLCQKRYVFSFLAAATLLCPLIGIADWQSVVFFLLPACYCGLIFGYGMRLGLGTALTVFLSSLLETLLLYLSLFCLQGIYGIDMVDSLAALLSIDVVKANAFFPLFAFAYCLGQVGISNLFLLANQSRLRLPSHRGEEFHNLIMVSAALSLLLALTLPFVSIPLAYLFLGFGLFLSLYGFPPIIKSKARGWLALGTAIALALLSSAIYHSYPPLSKPLVFAAPFLCLPIFGLRKVERKPTRLYN